MSKTHLLVLALAAIALASPLVFAHKPEPAAAPEPDETLRQLYLVSTTANETKVQYGSKSNEPLALSFDSADTAGAVHSYRARQPMRALVCLSTPCYSPFSHTQVVSLANQSQDIPLQWTDDVRARFSIQWTTKDQGPSVSTGNPWWGIASFHLSLGDYDYGSMAAFLENPTGRLVLEGAFARQPSCQGHGHGGENATRCQEPANDTRPELYAHDVRITFDLRIYDNSAVTFGRDMVLTLATDASSYLEVHEMPPPPPPPEPPLVDDIVVPAPSEEDASWASPSQEPVAVLPAPGAVLVLVGLLALALGRRRT